MGKPLACSSTDEEEECCIRERAQDPRQLQPRLPQPNERAELEAAVIEENSK